MPTRKPKEDKLATRTNSALEQAHILIKITDQVSYNKAVQAFEAAGQLKQQIVDHHAKMKKKAYESWQEAIAMEKRLLDPAKQAYDLLSRAIGTWDAEQKRLADEEAKRLVAAAEKELEEGREQAAADAYRDGADEEEVDAILKAPTPRIKVTSVSTYQKATGVSSRTRYTAVPLAEKPIEGNAVKAKNALIKLAAKNPAAYGKYLIVNESALNHDAQDQKEGFLIPGAYTFATETKAQPKSNK